MTGDGTIVDVARIRCRITPYDWPFARDEALRIDRHWAELVARKPALFDGRVLLSRELDVDPGGDGVLHAHAFEVGYRSFLSWRDFGFPGAPAHNLFAMPALRAADGAFMLGRMSATTANGGNLYFPAGTPEPGDVGPDGLVGFDANILRELEEETGLCATDVSLDPNWTLVFAGPLVAAMKITRSPLSAAALQARVAGFIAGQAQPELDGLVAVRDARDFDPTCMPPFMIRYLDALLRP